MAELRRRFDPILHPKPAGSEQLEIISKAMSAARKLAELLPGSGPYEWWPDWVDRNDPDTMVPVVERPEDIHVVVTGATSIPWMSVCPGWGNLGGFAESRPLPNPEGAQ